MQEGCKMMLQVGHACESASDVQPAHHADHAKCMYGGEHVQITAYQKVLKVASQAAHLFKFGFELSFPLRFLLSFGHLPLGFLMFVTVQLFHCSVSVL